MGPWRDWYPLRRNRRACRETRRRPRRWQPHAGHRAARDASRPCSRPMPRRNRETARARSSARSRLRRQRPRRCQKRRQDQHEAKLFRSRERLMQNGRGKKRYRQRHHPGKQRARMRRRREQQAGIRQQHRRAAADHDRRQPDPAEPLERETPAHHVGQQEQTGHAKAKCRDVPWREAGLKAEARHHDPSGPDGDGGEAVEGAAEIFRGSARRRRPNPSSSAPRQEWTS